MSAAVAAALKKIAAFILSDKSFVSSFFDNREHCLRFSWTALSSGCSYSKPWKHGNRASRNRQEYV